MVIRVVQSENILLRFLRRGHADDGCSCNHRAVPPSDIGYYRCACWHVACRHRIALFVLTILVVNMVSRTNQGMCEHFINMCVYFSIRQAIHEAFSPCLYNRTYPNPIDM